MFNAYVTKIYSKAFLEDLSTYLKDEQITYAKFTCRQRYNTGKYTYLIDYAAI